MNGRPGSPLGYRSIVLVVLFILSITVLSMVQLATASNGAVPDMELGSGSRLVLDPKGHIDVFTVWIVFPEPLDTDFCDPRISLFHFGMEELSIDSPDFPYRANWSEDRTTLTISSDGGLSGDDIFSFTVSIDLPLRTMDGEMLWEEGDRSEIVLTFGNANEFDLGYGILDILKVFILPFVLMVIMLIAIEALLRLTVKAREVDRVMSTTETLLRLIERTERMLRTRLVITFLLVTVLMLAYITLMGLALVSFTFAMVITWAAIFYISPWAILIVTTILFFIFRREDLAWRRRLRLLRDGQKEFMKGLEKE